MITIVGFSGSLRPSSYNTALLRMAAAMMPVDSKLEPASIRSFLPYIGDDEAGNDIPDAVTPLKDAIAAADGLVFVAPEYVGFVCC